MNSVLSRLLMPALPMALAAMAAAQGWGLFNRFPLPQPWPWVLSVVALVFLIYLQHVMVHALPLLWRLHRMHHADLEYDVTTGARFHPLEILLSLILALGPPVVAVLAFEVILNGMAMFNHSNLKLPLALDRLLRL